MSDRQYIGVMIDNSADFYGYIWTAHGEMVLRTTSSSSHEVLIDICC